MVLVPGGYAPKAVMTPKVVIAPKVVMFLKIVMAPKVVVVWLQGCAT